MWILYAYQPIICLRFGGYETFGLGIQTGGGVSGASCGTNHLLGALILKEVNT